MNKIKILLCILLSTFLFSCGNNCYKQEWKLKVVYLDGTVETLKYMVTSSWDCTFYVKSGKGSPCLVGYTSNFYSTIACGVRRFEILSFKKH